VPYGEDDDVSATPSLIGASAPPELALLIDCCGAPETASNSVDFVSYREISGLGYKFWGAREERTGTCERIGVGVAPRGLDCQAWEREGTRECEVR